MENMELWSLVIWFVFAVVVYPIIKPKIDRIKNEKEGIKAVMKVLTTGNVLKMEIWRSYLKDNYTPELIEKIGDDEELATYLWTTWEMTDTTDDLDEDYNYKVAEKIAKKYPNETVVYTYLDPHRFDEEFRAKGIKVKDRYGVIR